MRDKQIRVSEQEREIIYKMREQNLSLQEVINLAIGACNLSAAKGSYTEQMYKEKLEKVREVI